jgi:KaiC/GvpD/RAD55 family RecA-like ATPase
MVNLIDLDDLRNFEPKTDQPKIVHVSQLWDGFLEDYRSKKIRIEMPTQTWPLFNASFGGFRHGVTAITGETGSGKSSFGLNAMMQMVQQGIPTLLLSLEMTWRDVRGIFAQFVVEKPPQAFGDADVGFFKECLDRMSLCILKHHGPLSAELALKAVAFAAERFGIRFVFFDHMDYVAHQGQRWQNEAYVIGDFIRRLAGVSTKYELATLLVCHPRKLELTGTKSREVHMDEMKGSSSIKQEADAVLSIFQPGTGGTEMLLRLQKIRATGYSRNVGGKIRFRFDPVNLRFHESGTSLEWD